jgi:hypothetical protein
MTTAETRVVADSVRAQAGAGDPRHKPDLRAGDIDREAMADHLRAHHAAGRLDTAELTERIDRCYQAKTLGQLEELSADLPPLRSADERPTRRFDPWRFGLIWLVPAVVALGPISAFTGKHLIWLVIPLFFLTRRFGRAANEVTEAR